MSFRLIDPAGSGALAAALVRSRAVLPGLGLCFAIAGNAKSVEGIERLAYGHFGLDALLIAILIGATIRSAWVPNALWLPGIALSARALLEVAVVLMGASLSFAALPATARTPYDAKSQAHCPTRSRDERAPTA